MERNHVAGALLACVALALLVLTVLVMNVARLGSAISREVQRVQVEYMHRMGTGELVEHNALLLGQCVRREMLKSARAGFAHPDRWAVAARIKALPACTGALPAVPPPGPPVITAPRARPIVTSAPAGLRVAARNATSSDRRGDGTQRQQHRLFGERRRQPLHPVTSSEGPP